MNWTTLIPQMLGCLLLAGMLGGGIGWLVRKMFWSSPEAGLPRMIFRLTDLLRASEEKLQIHKQEKETLRTNFAFALAKMTTVQTELATVTETLKTRDLYIKGLKGEKEVLATELSTRVNYAAALQETHEKAQAQLKREWEQALATSQAEAEQLRGTVQALESNATAHEQTHAELSTLRQQFATQEQELAAIVFRLKNLEPLTGQINEREIEIDQLRQQLETLTGLPTEVANRDADILRLQTQLNELALLPTQLEELHDQLAAATSEREATRREGQRLKEHFTTERQEQARERAALQARLNELEPLPTQLAQREAQLHFLQARMQETEEELAKLRASALAMVTLETGLQEREAELGRLRLRVHEMETWGEQLRDREAELEQLRESLQQAQALEKQAQESAAELAQLRPRVTRLDEVSAQLQDREAELLRLRNRILTLENLSAQLQAWDTELREREAELARAQTRITELELLARTAKPPVNMPPTSQERDDLKKIYGIGPVLERLLNQHGVYSFRQIAHWTKADIAHYDSLLENFQGRIEREDWVRGAQEEYRKKYQERESPLSTEPWVDALSQLH